MGKIMRKRKLKDERGSIIVEAAFSLPFFMFTIATILSFVNICLVQTLMTNSMNGLAADFGKVSYLYSKLGMLGWKEGAATAGADVTNAGKTLMGMDLGDIEGVMNDLEEAAGILDNCEDLGASLLGALKEAGADIAETVIGNAVLDKLLEMRLSTEQISADALLKHYGIQDGLDGISWKLRFDPTTKEVLILATYKVRVLDFFNLEYDYSFQKLTRTLIWDPRTNYPGGESSGE